MLSQCQKMCYTFYFNFLKQRKSHSFKSMNDFINLTRGRLEGVQNTYPAPGTVLARAKTPRSNRCRQDLDIILSYLVIYFVWFLKLFEKSFCKFCVVCRLGKHHFHHTDTHLGQTNIKAKVQLGNCR